MDFVSLDIMPKETVSSTPSSPPLSGVSVSTVPSVAPVPFYRTLLFQAFIVITFISVLCFPQPEWLSIVLRHPIGSLLLASAISIVLLPEIEWWVVILGVLVAYIFIAMTGLIEGNIQ
jgi:hypothetical protein